MARDWISLLLIGLSAAGCFADIPEAGAETTGSSRTSTDGAPSPTTQPTTAGATSLGGSSATAQTPNCDDGVVVAGEVCFAVEYALVGDSYRFGFLADYDSDGERDLLYAGNAQEIAVRFRSDDLFSSAVATALGDVEELHELGLLRLSDDSLLDAVIVTQPWRLRSLLGTMAGELTDGAELATPEVSALTLGDMNGDERSEAIVASANGIAVWEVSADGAFTQLSERGPEVGFPYEEVRATDFTGDDNRDVLFIARGGGTPQVLLYLGTGDGSLAENAVTVLAETTDPTHMVVGDFDGDGASDFAMVDGARIEVGYGNDALSFEQSGGIDISVGLVGALVRADIDLDGLDDLIVGYHDRDVVSVHLARETREFFDPADVTVGHSAEQISTADANGDHVPDLVVTSRASQALTVLFSTN